MQTQAALQCCWCRQRHGSRRDELNITSWCRKLSESVAEMKQQVRAAQSDGGEALRVAQEEAHMRGEHIDKLKHALGEAAAAGDKFEVENKELRAKVKDLEPKARAMEVCSESSAHVS